MQTRGMALAGASALALVALLCSAGTLASTEPLAIVQRAYQIGGAPIPSGTTLPRGTPVRIVLYINNPGEAVRDVSLRDALDPAFAYVSGSVRYDNSVAACAGNACSPAEEATIYLAATSGAIATDAVDSDVISLTGGSVEVGDGNVANARLDIRGARVWAVVFTVRMQ